MVQCLENWKKQMNETLVMDALIKLLTLLCFNRTISYTKFNNLFTHALIDGKPLII